MARQCKSRWHSKQRALVWLSSRKQHNESPIISRRKAVSFGTCLVTLITPCCIFYIYYITNTRVGLLLSCFLNSTYNFKQFNVITYKHYVFFGFAPLLHCWLSLKFNWEIYMNMCCFFFHAFMFELLRMKNEFAST